MILRCKNCGRPLEGELTHTDLGQKGFCSASCRRDYHELKDWELTKAEHDYEEDQKL